KAAHRAAFVVRMALVVADWRPSGVACRPKRRDSYRKHERKWRKPWPSLGWTGYSNHCAADPRRAPDVRRTLSTYGWRDHGAHRRPFRSSFPGPGQQVAAPDAAYRPLDVKLAAVAWIRLGPCQGRAGFEAKQGQRRARALAHKQRREDARKPDRAIRAEEILDP